jgi:PadR family transcriptional regulator, regulatory protein PadR
MTHKVIAVRPPEPRTPDLKREMFKGFMETVLLSVIACHGPVYGYDIVRIVRESSQGFFALNAGSLYPSLARLMQRGWTDVKLAASP